MKKESLILTLAMSTALFSCSPASEKTTESSESKAEKTEMAKEEKEAVDEDAPVVVEDLEKLVMSINQKRTDIENNLGDPMMVATDGLSEKVKQKWSKFHFYTVDGNVVRVKTYPHEGISSRTEEFYVDNNMLILAVIEDDGLGERGKEIDDLDKLYYYENNEFVIERHKEDEKEYSLRISDAEELMIEFKEYMDIYKENAK